MRFRKNNDKPMQEMTRSARLMMLGVIALLAIVFVVRVATKPQFWETVRKTDFWQQMFGPDETAADNETAGELGQEVTDLEDDAAPPLQDDQFPFEPPASDAARATLSTGESSAANSGPGGSPGSSVVERSGTERPRSLPAEANTPQPMLQPSDGLTDQTPDPHRRIPRDMLRPVRDNTLGVTSSEWPVYFFGLKMAKQYLRSDAAAPPAASFAVVMSEPGAVRGRAFRIEGKLRALRPSRVDTSQTGFSQLYDAWIQTPDSGNQLVHVVCSSLPKSLLTNDGSAIVAARGQHVEAFAYFMKHEGYSTETAVSIAPLMLASTLQHQAVSAVPGTRADELTPWLFWVTLAIVGVVVLMLFQFQSSDYTFRRSAVHEYTRQPANVSFQGVEPSDLNDTLSELATQIESIDDSRSA